MEGNTPSTMIQALPKALRSGARRIWTGAAAQKTSPTLAQTGPFLGPLTASIGLFLRSGQASGPRHYIEAAEIDQQWLGSVPWIPALRLATSATQRTERLSAVRTFPTSEYEVSRWAAHRRHAAYGMRHATCCRPADFSASAALQAVSRPAASCPTRAAWPRRRSFLCQSPPRWPRVRPRTSPVRRTLR